MPGTDPTHWLRRFDADEWLLAADTELRHCEETLARRAVRPAVTHARRAAGMAWNAVLVLTADSAAALAGVWERARARGMDQPFGQAASLRQAYLSDALNQMADEGVALVPVFIDGRWREIDTEEDLGRAHALVDGWD